jgi:hypothetical protein
MKMTLLHKSDDNYYQWFSLSHEGKEVKKFFRLAENRYEHLYMADRALREGIRDLAQEVTGDWQSYEPKMEELMEEAKDSLP